MSDDPTCHLFLFQGCYIPIFIWRNLVNFGAFRCGTYPDQEKKLAERQIRPDGSKILQEGPHPIQALEASLYYCLPEDGIRMWNELAGVTLSRCLPSSITHTRLAAVQDFASAKIAESKRNRLEKVLDQLVDSMDQYADVTPTLKRRRADLAKTIDILVLVAQKNRLEAAAIKRGENAKRQRAVVNFADPPEEVDDIVEEEDDSS